MMIAVVIGKNRKKFGAREYVIVILLAIMQTIVTVQKLLTMEMPPLF
jgi:hypothetical protein